MNGKQWEDSTKSISQEAICGSGTSTVQGAVGVDEVQDARAEDKEVADTERYSPKNRDDPMNVRPRRPREPEEPDWEETRTKHGSIEPLFWQQWREIALSLSLERLLAVNQAVYGDRDQRTQNDTDTDAEKDEAGFARVEVVDLDFWVRGAEDDGEGGEEPEEHAEVEGGVEGEEGDD